MKKIEGIGVVEDMKNPAKLGISYSYGEQHLVTTLRMTGCVMSC